MVKSLALLALIAATEGCGKSTCEKYADMEWKCGNYPESQKDVTKTLAQGMCEGASADTKDKSGMAEQFKAEAECAAKFTDCVQYKACTAAAARPK